MVLADVVLELPEPVDMLLDAEADLRVVDVVFRVDEEVICPDVVLELPEPMDMLLDAEADLRVVDVVFWVDEDVVCADVCGSLLLSTAT